MDDVTRFRGGGMGCYEGELPPLDAVDREFAKLDLIREALADDPSDVRLQDQYRLKVMQLRELVAQTSDSLQRRQREIDARLTQLAEQYPELLDE